MSGTGQHVLVVDDEFAIRRFLRVALNAQGYVVAEAGNGWEALNAVVAQRPDIIILDLGLPDMDGVEVTRRLREWTQVPVIILSVREQENDKISALDAGADDYLTKPFSSGELMAPPARRLAPLCYAERRANFAAGWFACRFFPADRDDRRAGGVPHSH